MENTYSVIREARVRCGLSQIAAADAIGVTKQTFLKWEHRRTFPTSDKLPLISSVLKVPIQNLVSNDLNIELGFTQFHNIFGNLSNDELTRLLYASTEDHHALHKLAVSLRILK